MLEASVFDKSSLLGLHMAPISLCTHVTFYGYRCVCVCVRACICGRGALMSLLLCIKTVIPS